MSSRVSWKRIIELVLGTTIRLLRRVEAAELRYQIWNLILEITNRRILSNCRIKWTEATLDGLALERDDAGIPVWKVNLAFDVCTCKEPIRGREREAETVGSVAATNRSYRSRDCGLQLS